MFCSERLLWCQCVQGYSLLSVLFLSLSFFLSFILSFFLFYFSVSGFMLRSFILLELSLCGVIGMGIFVFYAYSHLVLPAPLVKEPGCYSVCISAFFIFNQKKKINHWYLCGFMPGSSIWFHWSTCQWVCMPIQFCFVGSQVR